MLKLVKGDRTCKTLRLCNVSSTLFQYILYIYSNRQTELVLFRYLSFATIPQPVYFNWHPNVNRISLFVHCTRVHSQIYKYTHNIWTVRLFVFSLNCRNQLDQCDEWVEEKIAFSFAQLTPAEMRTPKFISPEYNSCIYLDFLFISTHNALSYLNDSVRLCVMANIRKWMHSLDFRNWNCAETSIYKYCKIEFVILWTDCDITMR